MDMQTLEKNYDEINKKLTSLDTRQDVFEKDVDDKFTEILSLLYGDEDRTGEPNPLKKVNILWNMRTQGLGAWKLVTLIISGQIVTIMAVLAAISESMS